MKLAIFDKDGTIVRPKSGQTFVQSPTDQELIPGVAERIDAMRSDGWLFVLCSNQGGVAAGHKSLDDAIAEMQFCLTLIGDKGDRAYFCPDFEGKKCFAGDWRGFEDMSWLVQTRDYRKPGAGMLQAALVQYRGAFDDIVMIGDRPEDRGAAEAAGVRFLDAADWRNGAI